MGSMISGLLGGGSSPGQQQQMQALQASRGDIQQLRPELMQAKLNALANATSAYQGSNNALETLWGDPNAAPQGPPQGRTGMPRRMMGHDLPQDSGGQSWQAPPQRRASPIAQGISTVMDPLNFFGGR